MIRVAIVDDHPLLIEGLKKLIDNGRGVHKSGDSRKTVSWC
jgi:YesN/AraC family two-component response regulator